MDAVRVFISYSHEDDELRRELRKHLRQLERDGLVRTWDDREIPAGDGWADVIDDRLEDADVILLLVSADFMNSEYCYGKEMSRAVARQKDDDDRAIVIPVILRKCDWHTAPFAQFQALPRDGRPISDSAWTTRDDYFEAVATGLRGRIKDLVPSGKHMPGGRIIGPREPRFWQRARTRWILGGFALAAGLAGWWWMSASSAVDREIDISLTAIRQGRYIDARERLEKVSPRWVAGSRAALTLEKARLGACLESECRDIPVEKFRDGVDELSKQNPNDPDVLLFEGALAMRNGNSEEASGKFEQALKLDPRDAEVHYYFGSLHLQQGRYKEALDSLNHAVKFAPNAPHYLNARAFAKRMNNDPKGAEADYRQSVEEGSILSRLELAQLLWCAGNFQDSAAQQEEALQELQNNNAGLKGRNSLPWSFNTKADQTVTLNEAREKACFARLSLLASQYVMGKPVQPEAQNCGPNKSAIAIAVAWSLRQALDTGLAEPFSTRTQKFIDNLLAQPKTQ